MFWDEGLAKLVTTKQCKNKCRKGQAKTKPLTSYFGEVREGGARRPISVSNAYLTPSVINVRFITITFQVPVSLYRDSQNTYSCTGKVSFQSDREQGEKRSHQNFLPSINTSVDQRLEGSHSDS